MTHWRDTMVDRPETDGAVYVTGWTIAGLAVLGAVVGSGFSGFRSNKARRERKATGHYRAGHIRPIITVNTA